MIDKNLFLHDLAVVAILKDEGPYIKEWLDYHLLAGVDHFYLYNNDSSDNYEEIIAPYVEANLVTSTNISGKLSLRPAYIDAIKRFKFQSRYMAFIDLDEFIYPKLTLGGCIVDVVDEILSHDPNAAGLSIHWQEFGSNGLEKADYSRGVLERFTKRARKDFCDKYTDSKGNIHNLGNMHLKVIANPRFIKQTGSPHYANYFTGFYSVNERNTPLAPNNFSYPIVADKIAVNHYRCKSKEEFQDKLRRGSATNYPINDELFIHFDNNDEFDDSILKYRDARAENFSLESNEQKLNRVTDALIETLSSYAGGKIFDLETTLTCLALSTYLRENFPNDSAMWQTCEKTSLEAILKSIGELSIAEAQLFIRELPRFLSLPYPAVEEIRRGALEIIQQMISFARSNKAWSYYTELDYLKDILKGRLD